MELRINRVRINRTRPVYNNKNYTAVNLTIIYVTHQQRGIQNFQKRAPTPEVGEGVVGRTGYLAKFSDNCMKMKKNGTSGGYQKPDDLDPPLINMLLSYVDKKNFKKDP